MNDRAPAGKREIPMLRVKGSRRNIGLAIGEACAQVIRTAVDFREQVPAGRSVEEQISLAARYRDVTQRAMPWIIEEFDAMAEAAGVDPVALFAVNVEEIWGDVRPGEQAPVTGRCTDLVSGPQSSADGHLLVAHNNDMSAQYEKDLIAIDRRGDGEPRTLTIGNGIWVSTGWNEAGLSLTGNELSPNDERVGIPREVQVHDMLRERSLDGMVGAALRHDRASSYNNVLASRDGRVVNVEGSATDAELTEPDQLDHLVHTNHYVCERLLSREGDPAYARRSEKRFLRGRELLTAAPAGTVTMAGLRSMLSDHENAPDSICRHSEWEGGDSDTSFWCVVDVTEMRITFAIGNPCETDTSVQEFVFN